MPLSATQQRKLRRSLIAFGIAMGILALLWGPLVGVFPVLGAALGAYLSGSLASLALLMLVFVAVALGLLRRIEYAPTPERAPIVAKPLAQPPNTVFDNPNVYGAHAAAKSPSRFSAVSRGNFDQLRLYVEISHFRGGIGSPKTWTKPEPLLIEEIRGVVRGQTVTVDLVSDFERDGLQHWRWGRGGLPTDARYYFNKDASYRGRVLVAVNGDLEPLVSFINITDVAQDLPNLIGSQNFEFANRP